MQCASQLCGRAAEAMQNCRDALRRKVNLRGRSAKECDTSATDFVRLINLPGADGVNSRENFSMTGC